MANFTYHRTIFKYNLNFDIDRNIRPIPIAFDGSDYHLAFHYNYLHVLRSNYIDNHHHHHHHAAQAGDIKLAGTEDGWVMISRYEFIKTAHTFIRGMLSRMGMPADTTCRTLHQMVRDICTFVLFKMMDRHPLSNYNLMIFSLDVSGVTLYDERRVMEGVMAESAAQAVNCTIPAASSSVEVLIKKVDIADHDQNDGEECVICMEKLSYCPDHTRNVVRMPCSHLFHYDCIIRWLDISHFCPLCRYAMPTNSLSS